MDIRLRPHHIKRLPEYFNASKFHMFLTDFIWYGLKAARFRRGYFKKIVNQDLLITVGFSITDDICKECPHQKFCHTGNNDYRKMQMRLYELIVGEFRPIKSDDKVDLKYFSILKYRYESNIK